MSSQKAFADQIMRNGFAMFPGCFRTSEMDALAAQLHQSPLRRSRAGIRHLMQHPAVAALAKSSPLLGIAQSILGPTAVPYRATLFDKSPVSNWLVVWHQDTALPLQRREDRPGWGPWSIKDEILYSHAPAQALSQILALRVHLDASTTENGPLRVLPATHNDGVLTDNAIEERAGRISPVECIVEQGGVVVMRPLLVHASSKSHSQHPRRVLHIEYAAHPELSGLPLAVA